MAVIYASRRLLAWAAACCFLCGASASFGQVRRYEPARPTVSPYLNLFRDDSAVLPNYQTLVRPQLLQYQTNRVQEQINQQKTAEIERLRAEIFDLQQRQAAGLAVAPTGKSSWFARPSRRQQFLNTSRYYSQSGTAGTRFRSR